NCQWRIGICESSHEARVSRVSDERRYELGKLQQSVARGRGFHHVAWEIHGLRGDRCQRHTAPGTRIAEFRIKGEDCRYADPVDEQSIARLWEFRRSGRTRS